MSTASISESYYHRVHRKIDRFLAPERKASKANLNWARLNAYWNVGKLLKSESETLSTKDFRELRSRLSSSLKYHHRTLLYIEKFYEYWPKSPPATTPERALPWSKYVELLTVDEAKARNFYLKEALSSDWSCLQIRRAIKQDLYQNPTTLKRYQKGELKRQHSAINTFWAQVLRVIDGDTLQVRIDLRFGAALTQELRLRGLNCPELKDPSGQGEKAKNFTEQELQTNSASQSASKMLASPWVLIVTYKSDKFGRYVADVYYSNVYETEDEILNKGHFLNQKLLSKGLAKRVEY